MSANIISTVLIFCLNHFIAFNVNLDGFFHNWCAESITTSCIYLLHLKTIWLKQIKIKLAFSGLLLTITIWFIAVIIVMPNAIKIASY